MTTPRDPDVRISAFFETAQPDLPDRAFDAVRRDIHRVRRTSPLLEGLRNALPIAAAIAVAVVLLTLNRAGGQNGGPATPTLTACPTLASPGPSTVLPTPAMTGPVTFVSPLYRYSLAVPAGWGATPAVVCWDGVSAPSVGPNVDLITGRHLLALGFAGPFAGTVAEFSQDRIVATVRDHSDTCYTGVPDSTQSISIGGQPGLLLSWNCGARIDDALTVHAGIGYEFTIRDAAFSPTLDPTDLATVRSMLASLTFPPTPTTTP